MNVISVSKFELLDKSKPGAHNTIVFFLVNPSFKILSKADIMSQQFTMGTKLQ